MNELFADYSLQLAANKLLLIISVNLELSCSEADYLFHSGKLSEKFYHMLLKSSSFKSRIT